LDGEVSLWEILTVSGYFNLRQSWRAKIKFQPEGKVRIFGAVHQGSETLIREQVSKMCDGAILGDNSVCEGHQSATTALRRENFRKDAPTRLGFTKQPMESILEHVETRGEAASMTLSERFR